MTHIDDPRLSAPVQSDDGCRDCPVRLRLYVARSTPNSVRAERNLTAVLMDMRSGTACLALEVVDVFSEPKRAVNDGVVVTPTLIGLGLGKRIVLMGDLDDRVQLMRVLLDLHS